MREMLFFRREWKEWLCKRKWERERSWKSGLKRKFSHKSTSIPTGIEYGKVHFLKSVSVHVPLGHSLGVSTLYVPQFKETAVHPSLCIFIDPSGVIFYTVLCIMSWI